MKILESRVICSLDRGMFESEMEKFCNLYDNQNIEIQYSPIISSANDIMFTALVIARSSEVDGKK